MAKRRSHSIKFKRQIVQEFIAGETLHALAKRHDCIAQPLIRIWVKTLESVWSGGRQSPSPKDAV